MAFGARFLKVMPWSCIEVRMHHNFKAVLFRAPEAETSRGNLPSYEDGWYIRERQRLQSQTAAPSFPSTKPFLL
jgi:hypothetical protein